MSIFFPVRPSIRADIHQDDIRSDLLDIPKRDTVVFLAFEKIFPFAPPGYVYLMNTAAALVKFQIADSAKLLAVPQIDDFFTFKLRKKHNDPPSVIIGYAAVSKRVPKPCLFQKYPVPDFRFSLHKTTAPRSYY